jgi:hypothetical protein
MNQRLAYKMNRIHQIFMNPCDIYVNGSCSRCVIGFLRPRQMVMFSLWIACK